jgi:hypothetical protein
MFRTKSSISLHWEYPNEREIDYYLLVLIQSKKQLNFFQEWGNSPSYWHHVPNACDIKGAIITGHSQWNKHKFSLRISKNRIVDITKGDQAIILIIDHACVAMHKSPDYVNLENFSEWLKTKDAKATLKS